MQYDVPTQPPARIRVERVGLENLPVLIIENLFSDPAPLLRLAHQAAYGEPEAKNFPGIRAKAPLSYVNLLDKKLLPLIRRTFGFEGWSLKAVSSEFSLITQRPESLTLRQRIPHYDGMHPGILALLHYLTPGGCSGTSFYRHRTTGFERMTEERQVEYYKLLNIELKTAPPQGYISGESPLFEQTKSFEGVFNRMIVYQGYTLHSGDISENFNFTADPVAGRLTVNTFFTLNPDH